MNFNKANNLLGWLSFAIATVVYVLTIEPTVSFWDCGEYISTSYKLMVGHPPGAPFFQFLGAFFSIFAMGDTTQVASMINLMSALSSSLTILFLFWTITHFGRRLAEKSGAEMDQVSQWSVLGAGLIGALGYTFTDSFWFSAVEGEVYAMSSLFTAMTFWMILRWEREADEPRADRWLVLISFMMGLAIGVHMLAALVIPAIVMIVYYKKYKPNRTSFIIANGVGIVVLGFVFKVIFSFVLNFAGSSELFFTNNFGAPFYTGTAIAIAFIIGAIIFGLNYTRKKGLVHYNTSILALTFMILGYTTFISLVIRSNADTPIDENNPEDAVSLLSYLNREQYGDWPILYGWYYNSPLDRQDPFKDGNPIYERDEESGKYIVVDDRKQSIPNYDPAYMSLFPRMWDRNDPSHATTYKEWGAINTPDDVKPSFASNIRYFLSYQFNYMYFRYFMWNFSGRQNDEQGRGGLAEGQWITGIDFIDEARLGPQTNLPLKQTGNKGRNRYFMLPLIFGLIGLIYHYKKDPDYAWVNTLLFLMTGLAIVVYVNQYAYQPRERDYSYVGSFYAYAIWMGLGALALIDFLRTRIPGKAAALGVVGLGLIAVPGILAAENWDDHDRSNRYTARDFAKNYLDSCEKNAILFTNGDNDTFPLWYVQEVENYRTDVRIVNMSLLNTDWYIDQMVRAAYDAQPVPFTLKRDEYRQGTRDVVYYVDRGVSEQRWMAKDFVNWIKRTDPKATVESNGKTFNYYPTKKIRVPVDREKVLANGTVSPADTADLLPYIDWNLPGNNLLKRDLMIVDLIANNNWERPIYFAITVGNRPSSFLNLTDYFRLEGMAFRLVPLKRGGAGNGQLGFVDADIMYQNMMNEFNWGNMNDTTVYLDETNRRMMMNFRNNFSRLAEALIQKGDAERAKMVLDKSLEIMPNHIVPYDFFNLSIAEGYYTIGDVESARSILGVLGKNMMQEIQYYEQFTGAQKKLVSTELQRATQLYQFVLQTATASGDGEWFRTASVSWE